MNTPDRNSPIHIEDLVLEPARSKDPATFDPEVNIGEEDWERIIGRAKSEYNQLSQSRSDIDPSQSPARVSFIRQAFAIFTLSPQRFARLGIKREEWEMFRSLTDSTSSYYLHGVTYKHFFAPEFDPNPINFNHRRNIEGYAYNSRLLGNWIEYLDFTLIGKCLLPDAGFTPDPTTIPLILSFREELKRQHDLGLTRCWRLMALLKILCPENMPEFTRTDWQTAREIIEILRPRENTALFVKSAGDLKILAAREARINGRGLLEITMPETTQPFTAPTPPMPKRRNF